MRYIYLSLIAATAVLAPSCHSHSESAEDKHEHESGEIVLEPSEAERFGVESDTLRLLPFAQTISVSGEILPSAADASVVAAPTAGLVTLQPGITVGTRVSAGQAIARVSSAGLSGGDPDRAARVALENAQRELDRLTPLLADGLITRREYNEALAAVESARAAYSPAAASGVAKASKSGVITAINVTDGDVVATGQPIATVAASTSLTLRALVPSSRAQFLSTISGATINVHNGPAIDLADYNGRLLSSAPAGAGDTPGYVPVFFSFDATAPVVPGSATEIYLRGAERPDVLFVPKDALVEQMGTKFVFVKEGDHTYIKTPVTVGGTDGRNVEITAGVEPGAVVVTRGAAFVRLAEQASVAPEGHTH